ncbi:YheC/YheD family protein [Peribacillus deserti]|nr:YheC/YheD family protein [Peribacillus deserti]
MDYTIRLDKQLDSNLLLLNESTFEEINVNTHQIVLQFGKFSKVLSIIINDRIPDKVIAISPYLSDQLFIPELPYDCYFEGNRLNIGPVIGFIPQKKFYNNPKEMMMRFSRYNEIKGLIVMFRPKKIDRFRHTIEGYYLDPEKKQFIKGIFPYPNAVFNRVRLSKQTAALFIDSLFNYPNNINKLKFWSIMNEHSELKAYIPKTLELTDTKSLLNMLNSCSSIYLKPYNKSQGRGILHLKKTGESYLLKDGSFNSIFLRNDEELKEILSKRVKGTYLLQQEVGSKISGKKIDFRVYFHKDEDRKWYLSGMESKIAKEGSIISNFKNRDHMMQGEKALEEFYHLNPDKVEKLKERIFDISVKAIKEIEKSGYLLGEAAMDLIIDSELKIWLLEAQLNFAAEKKLARSEDERRVLPTILPAPFIYAKALTGFGKKGNSH